MAQQDTGFGKFEIMEDFLDTPDPDASASAKGFNITVASSATITHAANRHGGWARLVMAGDDGDAASLISNLAFEPDEGAPVIYETRLRTSDSSKSSIFAGLTDAEDDSVIIEDEDGTLNTVATDAAGFLLEGEQDETWQSVGVQNDVDNSQTALTSGADAADSTTQSLRMEVYTGDSGTCLFYIDGALVSTQTSFIRTSIVYALAVSADDRATSYNVDIDYIYGSALRGA